MMSTSPPVSEETPTKSSQPSLIRGLGLLDSVLLLVTDLRLPGVRFAGRIVAAPETDSLARLLKLLGAM